MLAVINHLQAPHYFQPAFDIDVAHLFPAEKGVIFQNHL